MPEEIRVTVFLRIEAKGGSFYPGVPKRAREYELFGDGVRFVDVLPLLTLRQLLQL